MSWSCHIFVTIVVLQELHGFPARQLQHVPVAFEGLSGISINYPGESILTQMSSLSDGYHTYSEVLSMHMSTILAKNVQLRISQDHFSRHAVGIENLMSSMKFFVKYPMAEAVFSCNQNVLDICQRCRTVKNLPFHASYPPEGSCLPTCVSVFRSAI